VKSENKFIQCDDTDISYCSADDMLETAYMVIYDKIDVPLPLFT
jgi:hypothetical protein